MTRARLCAAAAAAISALAVTQRARRLPLRAGRQPAQPADVQLAPGVAPNDFSESGDWKLAATPDSPLSNPLTAKVNLQADELCGIRGMSVVDLQTTQPPGSCAHGVVHTAWEVSTGRPDVLIDVLDSGIEWNSLSAMTDLRDKVHLNQGELPAPRHDLATALVPGIDCSKYASATGGDYNARGNYDVNRDGVFNVLDYACDSRVAAVVRGGAREAPCATGHRAS